MPDLNDLALRVEGLSGQDKGTDRLIVHRIYDGDRDMLGCVERGSFSPTGSLDAAMKLIPEGWLIAAVHQRNCRLPNWIWKVELWSPVADRNVRGIARNADLPAPALVAAALRARAGERG